MSDCLCPIFVIVASKNRSPPFQKIISLVVLKRYLYLCVDFINSGRTKGKKNVGDVVNKLAWRSHMTYGKGDRYFVLFVTDALEIVTERSKSGQRSVFTMWNGTNTSSIRSENLVKMFVLSRSRREEKVFREIIMWFDLRTVSRCDELDNRCDRTGERWIR